MLLEIKNLTKDFHEVKAVNNLSLNFENGVIGVVGHNGAGKSTLMRLLSGVYDSTEGEIFLDGVLLKNKGKNRDIFFLSDSPVVVRNGTVKQNFEFYASLFNLDRERFEHLITLVGLPLDRSVGHFSKGMRRQMFICIALSANYPVLLLDEAFDGVDPLTLQLLSNELQIMKEKGDKIIIISSHNLVSLEKLCDRFVILFKGTCQKQEKKEDLAKTFKKYQIIFETPVSQADLENKGIQVISYNRSGSICSLVTANNNADEIIANNFKIKLLEDVVITPEEIISLEMALRGRGGVE